MKTYIVIQSWTSNDYIGIDTGIEIFKTEEEAKECFDLFVDDYCRANGLLKDELDYSCDDYMSNNLFGEDILISLVKKNIQN